MSKLDFMFFDAEKFLIEEKKKLKDDRETINFLVNILQNEQQKTSPKSCNQSINNEIIKGTCQRKERSSSFSEEELCTQLRNQGESLPGKKYSNCRRGKKEYNSQEEKERLAYLFANSRNFFNFSLIPKRCHEYSSKNISWDTDNIYTDVDKENWNPECRYESPIKCPQNNEKIRTMVRFGEFSPLRLELSSLRKPFPMLGEYEERRRMFLEKRKQEYLEYLKNAKKNKQQSSINKKQQQFENGIVDLSDVQVSDQLSSRTYNEIFIPGRNVNLDFDACYTRMQQEKYRKELDEQVEEKERLRREQENKEKKLCEILNRDEMEQRRNLMKNIEDEYQNRIIAINKCKDEAELSGTRRISKQCNDENLENAKLIQSTTSNLNYNSRIPSRVNYSCDKNIFNKTSQERCNDEQKFISCHTEEGTEEAPQKRENSKMKNIQVPEYLQNPLMKQSAESCAIDDIEAFRKMQNELYKKELEKQILEKRRTEEEHKLKAKEEEEKINTKVQKEAEKLKEEFEKEGTMRIDCATQKLQIQRLVKDNLHKLKSETTNTRSLKADKLPMKPIQTLNKLRCNRNMNKKLFKNVTFAPENFPKRHFTENAACMNICESTNRQCNKDETTIIEAPYKLATKPSIEEYNKCSTVYQNLKSLNIKPTSPPIFLAERHSKRNFTALSSSNSGSVIPPSVSMSKRATQQFFKSNTFSDLSRLRKILKNQINCSP